MYKQLTYLNPDLNDLEKKIESLKSSNEKVRKGIYVRHNELAKQFMDIKIEFEAWKSVFSKEKK